MSILDYAIEQAKNIEPEKNKVRVYAVVVDKKDRILSEASNNYNKTHPVQARFAKMVGREKKVYLHAEIAALIKCKHDSAHKIYVARVSKDGEPLPACPCVICREAIKYSTIKSVEHTT